jgi:hypothetical protein
MKVITEQNKGKGKQNSNIECNKDKETREGNALVKREGVNHPY